MFRKILFLICLTLLCSCSQDSDKDKKEYEKLAEAVGVTIHNLSSNWDYESLAPHIASPFRTEKNFAKTLENGRKLGTVNRCDEGTFEKGTFEPIPSAIKYSGVCEFENGKGKVFMLFGLLKEGGFTIIALGVFPVKS